MELVELDSVCEIIAGQSPPSSSYNQDEVGVPFFQGKADFGRINPTVRYWCTEPKKMSVINDILFSVRAPVGSTNVNNIEASIGRGLAAIRCNKEIDLQFLLHYLRANEERIANMGTGSTFKAITIKTLKSIKIPLPPLPTQKKIASILDEADTLRQLNKQLITKYDALTQSLFLEMFGDTWLNPKGWEMKLVEELALDKKHSIKAGPFGSSLKKDYYVEKGYKIYGQEQVIKDDLSFGDYYIDTEKYESLKSCKVQAGDILISLVGTYGKIAIVPQKFEEGIINPRLMKISPNQKIIKPDFFKMLLQGSGALIQMKSKSRGGTMDIVNVGIMRKIKVPLPPINLQNQFAERANIIQQQKAQAQQSLQKSEDLFNSLLQKAFKGELVK
ncbi:type I restriction enzyme S subunit [Lacinutrix venerupis]|uniref:restriction endonuclease subunit S n=1 Tax=Lacinutrix venerupis TaxID=1486034 RepID=UPI000EB1143C|nr:restriction endonuclease subunit S [Lacinutrix venerupis]RLJ61609.1 type I restriction enzyme S subunit [Lacinutrix venerupis]